MSDWRPIKTAPRDGTRFLATNGKVFAACYWYVRIEPAITLLGYDEGVRYPDGSLKIGPRFSEEIPNPKAGQIEFQFWSKDNPSAFREEDEMRTDYDGNFEAWEPTHWMPLPAPPNPFALPFVEFGRL